LTIGETPHERAERIATYVLGSGVVTVTLIIGAAVALRDWRRRKGVRMGPVR
jgi:membrane-anchored mycosin MYCP